MHKQLQSYFHYAAVLITLLLEFIDPVHASNNLNEETNGKRPFSIGGQRSLPQPLLNSQDASSQPIPPAIKKSQNIPQNAAVKGSSLTPIPQRTPNQQLSQNPVKVAPRASTKRPSIIGEQRHSMPPHSQAKRGQELNTEAPSYSVQMNDLYAKLKDACKTFILSHQSSHQHATLLISGQPSIHIEHAVALKRFFNRDKYGVSEREEGVAGNHSTQPLGQVYIKADDHLFYELVTPLDFMMEKAVSLLAHHLFAQERLIAPTQVGVFKGLRKAEVDNLHLIRLFEIPGLVQIAEKVEGIRLDEVLKHVPSQRYDAWYRDHFSLASYQSFVLLSLLIRPADYKADNIMLKKEKDNKGQEVYHLVGIDNDMAFADSLVKLTEESTHVGVKNILYVLPLMDEPFTQEVIQGIKAWNPALIVIQWLKDLDHYNQHYAPLFEGLFKDKYDAIPLWGHAEGVLSEGEDPYPARFPFKLKQGTAIKLYQDLCQLKKLIEETEKVKIQQKTLTPHQAFTTIDPLLATYYKWLREEYKKNLIHQGADQAYMTTGLELYKEGVRKKLEYLFNQGLLDNTLQSHLSSRKGSKAYLYREQPLQEAAIEVLDNIDLQALILFHRKQVLEVAFLSFPELIAQAQHPQWKSLYLVHKSLEDKASVSLSLLKALIHRFPQSLTLLDEKQGYNPLHYAIENGADKAILEFLLKTGVNVNQRTMPKVGSSLTPLDLACMKNKADAFKLLVEHGAINVDPELAQKFSKILLPSSDAFKSFLALVSKHQELRWLFSLDHLFPSQGAGFKVRTARYGERGIHYELTNKIIDAKGNIINVMPEGRHPVGKISLPFHNLRFSLYFKEYPELPGLEEAVASLMRMTFGFGAPYSELIKLEGKPVLVSQGIPGRTLKAVLKENPSHLKTLDPYSTSSLILLSMLINPEDGKPDNYIFEERPEGNRLIAIDNDHAFVKAVAKSKPSITLNWSSPIIQVKTILYCLDQMQDKVHSQAREQFLKLNVGEVLESWLRHLRALNAQYHELFTEQERVKAMKEKECYIGIPFQEGAIKELYQKMSRLQSLLHDKPHLSHLELLCQLEPYLGKRYKPGFETPLSVQSRFDLIDKPFFSKDGKTITSSGHILSSMNIPLQESLLEAAKKDLNKDKDYRPNKALQELKAIKQENIEAILKEQGISKLNLTNLKSVKLEDNLSQVLKKIDFKSIPEVDQKALFELLKQRPFKALILKNAQALQNDFIKQHINFEHIKELNLTGCLAITDDILPILAEKTPALESLNMSYLPKIKNFVKVSPFKQDKITFPSLINLNLSHCNNIERLLLDARLLEKLKLENCMNINSFNFTKMPDLKYINLNRSKLIDIALLKTLIKASSEKIVSLKLEGCNKIEDGELWEAFPYLMTNYENELQRSKEGIKAHLLKVKILEELDLSYGNIDINILDTIYKTIWQKIDTINSLNLSRKTIGIEGAQAISQSPTFINLSSLNLCGNGIEDKGAQAISQSSTLTNLTSLDLSSNSIGNEGAQAINKNTSFINLSSLNLAFNNIGSESAIAISNNSTFRNLSSLNMAHNTIMTEGVEAICQSTIFTNLKSLDLTFSSSLVGSFISQSTTLTKISSLYLQSNNLSVMKDICENLKNLTLLDLSYNFIGNDGIIASNEVSSLTNLTSLNLERNSIFVEGAKVISNSSSFKNLSFLNLRQNKIGDEGVIAISQSSTLTNLSSLDLGLNSVGDTGAKAITISSALTNLTYLNLGWNNIGDDGAIAISQSSTLTNLSSLDLWHNSIGDKGAKAISNSTTLKSLISLKLWENKIGDNVKKDVRESKILTKLTDLWV